MTVKTARADVTPVRQRTQFTCMTSSMMMCLQANGVQCNEAEVNKVMGARPMKGAAWEDALACAQHYGMRATLTCPATIRQIKAWTDRGIPVMIAWNPEGRDWSHASVVFDVTEGPPDTLDSTQMIDGEGPGLYVWVADSNLPNPAKTTRIVQEDTFYSKWYEKWPNYLVRRPACAIEPEITSDGRQVVASTKSTLAQRVAESFLMARRGPKKKKPQSQKDKIKTPKGGPPKAPRKGPGAALLNRRPGAGAHKDKKRDVAKGKGKGDRARKHKKDYRDLAANVAAQYLSGDSNE